MRIQAIAAAVLSGLAAVVCCYLLLIQLRLGHTLLPILSARRANDPIGYWSGIAVTVCLVAILAGLCAQELTA